MTEQAAAPPPPARPNWMLLGCGGCLGLLALVGLSFAVLAIFGAHAIKNASLYQEALAPAVSSPAVQEELGAPITDGAFPSGSAEIQNEHGSADFFIPISGPKGRGKVHYAAVRENSHWRPTVHAVLIERNGRTINLLR